MPGVMRTEPAVPVKNIADDAQAPIALFFYRGPWARPAAYTVKLGRL